MRIIILLAFCFFQGFAQNGALISVVYDFDGMDEGQVSLTDGDYKNGSLEYAVSANPSAPGDVIGDRVLKITMNWQNGEGDFGKAMMRFVQLDASKDHINFYFHNPSGEAASVLLVITEDDNGNDVFEFASDDKWTKQLSIAAGGGWQLISVPLREMADENAGGNGVFDAAYTSPGGMLFQVGLAFQKPAQQTTATYYIDMICFSSGKLATGGTVTDLPPGGRSGECRLGALTGGYPGNTPAEINSYLAPGHKVSYVNWFLYYANSGTTPDQYPGPEVQQLIDGGYVPIITWEMMYAMYARLDPVQPRLDKILNGSFDWYIDAFAQKLKDVNGNVILRIFHEFEGDWYSWSLTQNNNDPQLYIAAFRHVVDRFRKVGATNVKWMWCVNAEPKPYKAYNWIISAYPGDSYVDIIATDIYNHPDLGVPDWRSFRFTMAETYYYLTTFLPQKPLYVCEVGCRERYGSESGASQTKAGWLCQMNRDLKSWFDRTQALVFFSLKKEHDWRINSSESALSAFNECIMSDPFYTSAPFVLTGNRVNPFIAYPNPFIDRFKVFVPEVSGDERLFLFNLSGQKIMELSNLREFNDVYTGALLPGVYFVELHNRFGSSRQKVVKSATN